MKEPIIVRKEAFQAIGVSITTTNEIEASTEGKIPGLWNQYFQEQIMSHIPNQQTKETFAFYSNYESDETGTYQFTIGMPVSSLEDAPENMTTLTIPAATYAVFTTRKDQLLKSFAKLGNIFGNGQKKTNVLLQQTLSFTMKKQQIQLTHNYIFILH